MSAGAVLDVAEAFHAPSLPPAVLDDPRALAAALVVVPSDDEDRVIGARGGNGLVATVQVGIEVVYHGKRAGDGAGLERRLDRVHAIRNGIVVRYHREHRALILPARLVVARLVRVAQFAFASRSQEKLERPRHPAAAAVAPPRVAVDDLLLGKILEPLVEYESVGFELGDRREGPARTARPLVRHRGNAVVLSPVVCGHERGARGSHERQLALSPSLGEGQEPEELLLLIGRKSRDGRLARRPLVPELGVPFVDLGDPIVLALLRESRGRRQNEHGRRSRAPPRVWGTGGISCVRISFAGPGAISNLVQTP